MVTFFVPVVYFVAFILSFGVEWLNIRELQTALPKEFVKFYNPKRYALSQKYLKEKTYFSLVEQSISTFIFITFLLLGGFNALTNFALVSSRNEIVQGIIFLSVLLFASTALSVPFNLHETFGIEEKYKFNKTTPRVFWTDTLKSLVLSLLIGSLLFAVILAIFAYLGTYSWLIAWLSVTVITFLLTFIAPVVFLPLFNKFTPLPKGELRDQILKLAQKHSFKLEGIYEMDNSKRSSKSNAFFVGFGKYKRIVLFDTLMKNFSVEEIVAVLAHELGHFKKGHIKKNFLWSTLSLGLVFFVFSRLVLMPITYEFFRIENQTLFAGIVVSLLLLSPFQSLESLLSNAISRKFEFEADQYAVASISNSNAFAEALKKLTVENLGNLTPHPLKVLFDYSHPPILTRLKRLGDLKNKH